MIIYKATNKINGKSYIGQTVKTLSQRKDSHISDALNKRDNMYFHKAIRKHNEDSFEWKIIHNNIDTMEELNRLEIYYIGKFNTFENGYNLTMGGEGIMGRKHSEETKRKISKKAKGRRASEETKKKMSESRKGRRPMLGKHLTEDHKKKLSEIFKGENNPFFGKKHSEETKQKMSEAWKNRAPVSLETRKRMSKAHKKENYNG